MVVITITRFELELFQETLSLGAIVTPVLDTALSVPWTTSFERPRTGSAKSNLADPFVSSPRGVRLNCFMPFSWCVVAVTLPI